ncbi:hypothetical protein PR048_027737 [Dryococelus australis]|uniref:Uncharacterized protein n=1 Tax=Dryococelus australis TaxID=614101 RepID=A0ABQ9GHC9_9NEOP|nr:hypothetical protein PR048_027737 [Dryococelus australis]
MSRTRGAERGDDITPTHLTPLSPVTLSPWPSQQRDMCRACENDGCSTRSPDRWYYGWRRLWRCWCGDVITTRDRCQDELSLHYDPLTATSAINHATPNPLSISPLSNEWTRGNHADERKGDLRENPPTSGIVRHDSHILNDGVQPRREWNSISLGGCASEKCVKYTISHLSVHSIFFFGIFPFCEAMKVPGWRWPL